MIIKVGVEAKSQYEVMKYIAKVAYEAGYITQEQQFVEALLSREKEGSTGFGYGVAIPHGSCECVKESAVVVCKLSQGVQWRAIDGEAIQLVIGLVIPPMADCNEHLLVLSRLAIALIDQEFLQAIKGSDDPEYIKTRVMDVMECVAK